MQQPQLTFPVQLCYTAGKRQSLAGNHKFCGFGSPLRIRFGNADILRMGRLSIRIGQIETEEQEGRSGKEQGGGVAGVVLGTRKTSYVHRDNGSTAKYRKNEGFEHIIRDIHTLDEPLAKVLFASEDESILLHIADLLASHPLADEFSFIRTDAEYYEIVPKGTSKGTLTLKLSEITGIPLDHIIAIGDNDNDAPMLKVAGTGVAVANASAAAKAAADYITVSNEEHALARIIRELEENQ